MFYWNDHYTRTAVLEQTVLARIRLLLWEQSDQGLHCMPFHKHFIDLQMVALAFLNIGEIAVTDLRCHDISDNCRSVLVIGLLRK